MMMMKLQLVFSVFHLLAKQTCANCLLHSCIYNIRFKTVKILITRRQEVWKVNHGNCWAEMIHRDSHDSLWWLSWFPAWLSWSVPCLVRFPVVSLPSLCSPQSDTNQDQSHGPSPFISWSASPSSLPDCLLTSCPHGGSLSFWSGKTREGSLTTRPGSPRVQVSHYAIGFRTDSTLYTMFHRRLKINHQ